MSLREVESFGKYLGGSPTNVAVAAAQYGRDSAVITRTGEDPFGEFLHDALRGFGVDDRYVTAVPGLNTPIAFCEIFPPDDFPLYFYREPKAPDMEIHAGRARLRRDPRRARVLGHGHRAVGRAEPQRHAGRARGAREGRDHRARPRLPPDVLVLARGGPRVGRPRARARDRRGRQPRRDRHRRRRARAARGGAGAARPRRRARDRQAGPARACSPTTARPRSRCRPCRSRSSTGSARATRSAARSATGCCRTGTSSAGCASATPPARSSRRGWRARTRCQTQSEVEELLVRP